MFDIIKLNFILMFIFCLQLHSRSTRIWCQQNYFFKCFSPCCSLSLFSTISNILLFPYKEHRRTGNFCPGGVVNHLPKKFLENSRKETRAIRCNNIGCTSIWKCLDTVFQGQYLPSLSINYVAINKHLEKLPPQLY